MSEWQDIATAPKNGAKINVRRIYEGRIIFEGHAVWRSICFSALEPDVLGRDFGFEPYEAQGWMYPESICDKRVPEPTHWQDLD